MVLEESVRFVELNGTRESDMMQHLLLFEISISVCVGLSQSETSGAVNLPQACPEPGHSALFWCARGGLCNGPWRGNCVKKSNKTKLAPTLP